MGYTTDFSGEFTMTPQPPQELVDYINRFAEIRHMKRDVERIKEVYPDWKTQCFNGDLGVEGEYFIGGEQDIINGHDDSVLDYNRPGGNASGLWCQWVIEDGALRWDYGEKFYCYDTWLRYLIKNFFAPSGIVLNGDVTWQGEDYDDFGCLHVENNELDVQFGIHVYSMNDFADEELVEELERRGYTVTKD